jgi:anthranilate phosphoribosyltransferase
VGLTLQELGGWPAVLRPLSEGRDLSAEQATAALTDILEGNATSAQIAAFATLIHAKGETAVEMGALLETLLQYARPITIDGPFIDTCGTGGSVQRKSACFNVSTIASFVVAGAGVRVAKHGGRAASATSSSADLVEALGVNLDLSAEGIARCVAEAGVALVFAPSFHPAARHVGPTRRELGVPTVFNFVLVLANPARPRRQVVGVSRSDVAPVLLDVLVKRGSERAMVVYGQDGLDELTTTTTSTVLEWIDGQRRSTTIDPADLGLAPATAADLCGGDVATNRDLALRVLDGAKGAHRDVVCLNAAAGLVVGGVADDLRSGLDLAYQSIDDGRARAALDRLVEVSQAAATG